MDHQISELEPACTGDFFAAQFLRLPAEALDPDKRITADDDWHLEQCKAKQEKSQLIEIGDAGLKTRHGE